MMAIASHPRQAEQHEAKNVRYHDQRGGAGIGK